MIKVSIIVPVYNMGNSLKSCIESLLQQTYKNIEVIIIDDGSTDNTFQVCAEYKKANKNIKSWHTENRGSGPARNYGINKATGDFVFFMDADDILDPDAISILVKEVKNQQVDLVVFGYKKVNSKGKVLNLKTYKNEVLDGDYIRKNYHLFFDLNFKKGVQGAPWNKFFNLKIIKKYDIKYPSMKRHQDEVFISRYIKYTQKVSFIDKVLYTHYVNDVRSKLMKFPVTYIDIVKELYKHRMEIIPEWNRENKKILGLIYVEYIYNSIKAFDIIFSKKVTMSKKERMDWLRKEAVLIPIDKELLKLSGYKSKVKLKQIELFLDLIEKKQYRKLYLMHKIRVLMETKFNWIVLLMKKNMVSNLRKN